MSTLQVQPLTDAPFGAKITLPDGVTDPSLLDDENFELLKQAVQTHLVVVIPGQEHLQPTSQHKLTQRFDHTTTQGNYGHEKNIFLHKDSVLAKDGKLIKHQPQVVRVGNGHWTPEELEALEAFPSEEGIVLEHPMWSTFHNIPLTQEEIDAGVTRYFRWHIDAALYGLNPPMVTTLLGLHVPPSDEKQFIVYENGDKKEIQKGATAFASGAIAYASLSEEDKKFVQTHSVEYFPHPYITIGACRATSDGLTIAETGAERPLDQLPPWEPEKVKTLPLIWTNPTTKQPHVQVHACCVRRIVNSKTGEVVAETAEARKLCQKFLTPAISAQNVYAHAWQRGDLAIFFNRGVTHSVTSTMREDEKRLMHQCNIASGVDPVNESAEQFFD